MSGTIVACRFSGIDDSIAPRSLGYHLLELFIVGMVCDFEISGRFMYWLVASFTEISKIRTQSYEKVGILMEAG